MWFTKICVFLCLLLIHGIDGDTIEDCKADGWTTAPRPGGKSICFKAFAKNSNLTFAEANLICTGNKAFGAPMKNKDDAKAVIDAMKQLFHNNVYLFGERYQIYLGAYHTAYPEGDHGKLYWSMDHTEVNGNYTLWDVGQPDIDSQHISQHEDCLMFRWHPNQEDQSVRWHDVACDCKAENKCYETTGGIVCAKMADGGTTNAVSAPEVAATAEKCHDGTQKSALVVAIDASWATMAASENRSLPAQLNFVNELFKSAGECDKLKVIFYAGSIDTEHRRCRSADFNKSDNLSVENHFNNLFNRTKDYYLIHRNPMKFYWSRPDCAVNRNTKDFYRNAAGFIRSFVLIGTGGMGSEIADWSNLTEADSDYNAIVERKFRKLKKTEGVRVITIYQTSGNWHLMKQVASNPEKDAIYKDSLNENHLNKDLVEDVWEKIREVKQ